MGGKKKQSCSTHVQECLFKDFEGKKSILMKIISYFEKCYPIHNLT